MPRPTSLLRSLLLCAVCAISLGAPRLARAAESRRGEIDLMPGYWSHYFRFSPAPLEPRLLVKQVAADPQGLGKTVKLRKIDLSKPFVGWPFYYANGRRGLVFKLKSPEPPAGWTKPDFDDSAWPRQRWPQLTGRSLWRQQATGLACFRARFVVPDPARVRKLLLEVSYRGGAVIYVNGQEVGRAHLPKGKITGDIPGEVYSTEAYVLPAVKIGSYDSKKPRVMPELWDAFPGPSRRIKTDAKKFGVPIENLTSVGRHGRGAVITRKEWEKVRKLRNRTLGPIEVPGKMLRKGANVLAVEIHRGYIRPGQDVTWLHSYFTGAKLRCEPPGSVRPEARPGGLQVWTEDIHRRCFDRDFGPAGGAVRPVRIVGARNGLFSGQVAVGSGRRLAGLKAQAGDLVGPGGAKIPGSAVRVRYGVGHGTSEIGVGKLSANAQGGRGMESVNKKLALLRYDPDVKAPPGLRGRKYRAWQESILAKIKFYDHLTHEVPKSLPADSCLPVWVTVKVPAKAAAGEYRGELSISAGGKSVKVPLRLQVMDWTVPEPRDFGTIMALEPSPYSVAKHYKVKLWSDRHFKLMEKSYRLLGEIGGDMVLVPVLLGTEFGNGNDSMIRWKKAGGKYECDFKILERFLKMVKRYQKPRCISFVVCHSTQGWGKGKDKPQVLSVDGKPLDVPKPGTAAAAALWRPLTEGLKKVMAKHGMAKSLHWGYLGDSFVGPVNETIKMFAKLAPGVGWARGAHGWGKENSPFSFGTTVRISGFPMDRRSKKLRSQKGWQRKWVRLVFTRVENATANVYGFSGLIRYRQAPEAAITAGSNGIGRWGADYWAKTYTCWGNVSPTVLSVLWPGPAGAEGGARFECLREGLQQTEARIFLEKKLENKSYAAGAGGRAVQELLNGRIRDTLIQVIQSADNCPQPKIEEYYWGWQPASWDLYAAAARAAGSRVPTQKDKTRFFGTKP